MTSPPSSGQPLVLEPVDIAGGVREVLALWEDGLLPRGEVESRLLGLAVETDIEKVLARLPAPWHDVVLAALQRWAEAPADSEPITIFGGIYAYETEPNPTNAAEMRRELEEQQVADAEHFKKVELPAIRSWWAKRMSKERLP